MASKMRCQITTLEKNSFPIGLEKPKKGKKKKKNSRI